MYRYTSASKQTGFRSEHALSNDVIRQYTPSVFAEAAHESRSDAYGFVPTIQVLDKLRTEGFAPYEVRQNVTRIAGKREFTKHLIRLRHATVRNNNDVAPEIILLNSHDGASSFQLLQGYFRYVCSNGLVCGDVQNDIRIRHNKNVIDNVIDGCTRVLDTLALTDQRLELYKSIELSREEQQAFAKAATGLRWDEGKALVQPDALIVPRRIEDQAPTLWNTFNCVQENLLQGGQRGRTASRRRTVVRPVSSLTEDTKINRALWTLADEMAKLKA